MGAAPARSLDCRVESDSERGGVRVDRSVCWDVLTGGPCSRGEIEGGEEGRVCEADDSVR